MSGNKNLSLEDLNQQEVLSSEVQTSEAIQKKSDQSQKSVQNLWNKYELSQQYNVNQIVLQVKNPVTAHVYWEYTADKLTQVAYQAGYENVDRAPLVIRLYDLTLGPDYNKYYDINITRDHDSWYVHDIQPGRSYVVKLGVIDSEKKLNTIAQSNLINTPRNRISDQLDQEWMTVEEHTEEIYKLSRAGKEYSSAELVTSSRENINKQSKLEMGYSSLELLDGRK